MADDLLNQFLLKQPGTVDGATTPTPLIDSFLKRDGTNTTSVEDISTGQNLAAGFGKGVMNVANTIKSAGDYATELMGTILGAKGTQGRYKEGQESIEKQNTQYQKKYGESTAAGIGEVGGEIAATLPLTPVKAIGAIKGLTGALPTISATGEKIAAPFLNKAIASVGTGALGGGVLGAATSSGNDQPLWKSVAKNTAAGAIGGPVLQGAGEVASMALPAVRRLWAGVNISKIADQYGMPVSAIKNAIDRLSNAGLTPEEAQREVTKLGPSATLMDLAESLTTEGSGLAAMGGKTTELLKGRMAARAETANSKAVNLIKTVLGNKPDLEAERSAIKNAASNAVKADYDTAYASGQPIDVSGIASDIDKSLKLAVGKEANTLAKIKSYLFDDTGKLKNDIPSLHKVRQALDDVLDKLPKKGTSATSSVYRAVENVRNGIDTQLKTNTEMKAADQKFAEKMKIANGLDLGYEVIKKGVNKEEFEKLFNSVNPETQDTLKKGMLAAIHEYMDRAQKGELSGAQQLFGKKSVNRANLVTAFGQNGEIALDALKKEATERFTEQSIMRGSQTAERLAVQRRYGEHPASGILGDAMKGLALDVAVGSPGGAAGMRAISRTGHNMMLKMSQGRLERLTEGTADLISRQGSERDLGLSILDQVQKIQSKVGKARSFNADVSKLPVTLPAQLTNRTYLKLEDRSKNE